MGTVHPLRSLMELVRRYIRALICVPLITLRLRGRKRARLANTFRYMLAQTPCIVSRNAQSDEAPRRVFGRIIALDTTLRNFFGTYRNDTWFEYSTHDARKKCFLDNNFTDEPRYSIKYKPA